jgi:hypothetical protein
VPHHNKLLPWDHLTDAQVDEVRQKLRKWWPQKAKSRDKRLALHALSKMAGVSTTTLLAFNDGRYKSDNRAIAWFLAEFFGIKLPEKEG